MIAEPLVRARHLKSLLTAVDALACAPAVRAHVGAAVLGATEGASGIDWLPLEHDLAFTGAIYQVLPAAEADAFFRAHTSASFEGPLLRTMVDTAVRLFGLDPGSWARWVPKGWSMIFRGTGEWSVGAIRPGEARLGLAALPDEAIAHAHWLRSVARSLDALCDLARCTGGMELAAVDLAARRADFVLRWAAGARRAG
ncbi:MAG TPA: hypothetical protein VML50_14675 [Anaeromyxobacter sp.]|nr:hypothetical protein [Anaeromyxobacter sp.]